MTSSAPSLDKGRATGQERQHREDDGGVGSVYAGLAHLFRLLRNAYGAENTPRAGSG